MEEIVPILMETPDIGDFCRKMYSKVGRENPVTGLFNGVRIVMFATEE